ncbi:FGGY-family carbohydrate kinase [Pannus brasiliensis CCIBt3594]|uniref:D-ribulose kinase n=1 Tax=Pannus brasiliensis CCIBt3594 TaxID=1427578 RepID=A0AAW9QFJ2_9CHRO
MGLFLGIDFGTSGARAIAIDDNETLRTEISLPFTDTGADRWKEILFALLESLPRSLRLEIEAIAIDGTSSTVLLCDASGNSIEEPIFYNDTRGNAVLDRIREIAPADHPVISSTSSLAKLFWYADRPSFPRAAYFLHQADWLAFLLHGKPGISDYHNALKLGYDVENLCYPDFLQNLPFFTLLPQVLAPGTVIGTVTAEIALRFGLNADCRVCTGTTDSIAAFLASGARSVGDAVTSLGSTLVIKLLSDTRVDSAKYGIYSHRLGDLWLTGGASNTGGAVLRQFFSDGDLARYSLEIDPDRESTLDYYPLLRPGDRFPINDPLLAPRLEPRPDDDIEFLHGLLESIARIEALGYQRLRELGASPLQRVYTAGGGAKNPAWGKIRERRLGVPVLLSKQTEAAYGSALLARESI